mgnify:CR=1 FL=1
MIAPERRLLLAARARHGQHQLDRVRAPCAFRNKDARIRGRRGMGPTSCGKTAGRGVRAASRALLRKRLAYGSSSRKETPGRVRGLAPSSPTGRQSGCAASRSARPLAPPAALSSRWLRLVGKRAAGPDDAGRARFSAHGVGHGKTAAGRPSHGMKPKGASSDDVAETPIRRNGLASG